MKIKTKLEIKYRWKLFKKLYLKRYLAINVFIFMAGFFGEENGLGIMALCIAMPTFLFIFMFADYHAPNNNSVRKDIKTYKESDEYLNKIGPVLKRRKRAQKINEILK